MNTITLSWIGLPFFVGFVIFIFPKLDRYLSLFAAFASAAYAAQLFLEPSPLTLVLLDNFGVTLQVDRLSGFFILTNAIVTASVIFYCWYKGKTAFFYAQTIILHGSLNAAFVGSDFVSLYVALEVSGIAAFLLIAYPRTDRSIWVGLRYLFASNTAMLFYLVGAVLVYQSSYTFSFAGLSKAPTEAVALIFLGLLVKGGVFISGLWLPLTHSESETPVSALMSGIVVKAGIYPLVRCALIVEELDPIIRIFGVGAALLGASCAIFERDTKRMLALSTVSQLGWIVAAPSVAGFYALTHGVVKSALFLTASALPSRDLKQLQQQPIDRSIWIVLVIASLSISGFPLLSGFAAKTLTLKNLLPWQEIAMNVAAVGTAIAYARFIFLRSQTPEKPKEKSPEQLGFWMAVILLLGGLVAANIAYLPAYTLANGAKAIAIVAVGWLAYWLVFQKTLLKLPRMLEEFDHLVGTMSLMLILVFWMVWL
ncbi:MAG: cation:proton antiporter [Oscillatoriales cyanobacterium RU_3_3]|nr:cation:proton antiporter [Oscillatoriales cyanobacterium RU_3_3]